MVFIGLTPEGRGDLAAIEEAIQDGNIPWSNGYGAQESLEAYQVPAFPTHFVIGRDGRVVWNSFESGTLEEALDKALADGT